MQRYNSVLKLSLFKQHLLSISFILTVAGVCFLLNNVLGYKIVALILIMAVSINAMLFEILPVLITAILSALIWNFFFIPPIFNFQISKTEDLLMFLLYFVIALVNGVLTFQIRKAENRARDKEEKEKTIKLYNTLLNSLSHELRTPIATIIGSVDTLKENKSISHDNQAQLLNEIETAGLRLNNQVDNLLNMSRLESGNLQPKYDWCDVNEIIFSTIHKLPNHKHVVQFNPNDNLPLYKLDAGLLQQIIVNILQNALLYTPEKSTIIIQADNLTDLCKITISDNGQGFESEYINKVFDKFYRLPNSKTGGSGLGLSIVKGFVEAQNGKVNLENNKQGGATFTIEIPAETSYINNLKNE